jgi:SAM-dependent methyltransferase
MSGHVEIVTPVQSHEFLDSWYELSDASHFWFKWRAKAFIRQLADLDIPLDQEWNVLDVGCGVGVLRKQLEIETKWNVSATDLDYGALQQAGEGRGTVMYYDITEKRPEFEKKYDAILLFDVLEHIEDTAPFIEALLFHLKKDGFLFVNVPAMQSLFSKYDEIAGHFRRYDTKDLPFEFSKFPIDTKDVRFWGLANVPILFLRKQFLSFFGKNKSDEQIIQDGFKPPNELINKLFVSIMNVETFLLKKPFLGSSVLWTGQKK